jgi:hypothetical protein
VELVVDLEKQDLQDQQVQMPYGIILENIAEELHTLSVMS